MRRRTTVNKA
uniref:Uncharacterized protein n=1 Tax=Lepeophtheirus salmonis TaxID=72036 RepID=A0A0K2TUU6_LEPSM